MRFLHIPTDRLEEARTAAIDLDRFVPPLHFSAFSKVESKYLNVPGANGVYTETTKDHILQYLDVKFRNSIWRHNGLEMTESIFMPANNEVVSTNINFGGYGINNPIFYKNFGVFSAYGQRQVNANLLGAGTRQFAEANLSLWSQTNLDGPTANLETYRKYTAIQLDYLLKKYAAEEKPVTVSGMSTGGYTVLSSLVDPELLSDEVVSKIDAVFLDAPLPLGPVKFGLGQHFMNMAQICMLNGYPQGLFGFSGEITPGIIRDMMIADPSVPEYVSKEIAGQCFKATGVFPQIALSTERDKLRTLHIDNPKRAKILQNIPITYFLRPNDRTVNSKRVQADANTYRDLGYNITVHYNQLYPNSHLHAPLLNLRQTLEEYGR